METTIDLSRPMRLTVTAPTTITDVVLGRNLLAGLCGHLEKYRTAHMLIIADENVATLYGNSLCDKLRRDNYETDILTIPSGENSKTLDTLIQLYAACESMRICRRDVVIALGGGMIGDVAGMLAATYLRGLEYLQIPTSLVSMVTACIGGKTGVNFMSHKNLIGAFKQPSLVVIDLETIQTLPPIEFLSGLGELVTIGVLGAPEIFQSLETGKLNPLDSRLDQLVISAIRLKSRIVEADPFDRLGIRIKLNLGHTFGHALESLSNFTLPHGIAVAVGLYIASRLAMALRLCSSSMVERIRRTLIALKLPVSLKGYRSKDVIEVMQNDKKRNGGLLRWVLPVAIGEVITVDQDQVPSGLVEGLLDELVWEGES